MEVQMNFLKTCLAVLLGFIIGAAIYHPKPVKAAGVRMEKVTDGFNNVIGSDVVGFACTHDECFVLSK
jgi:hypothetical protein